MALIETVNLCQRREGQDILTNINLAVEPGEVVALIGPTGAGKTTLLRLLNLLDMPESGKLYFEGIDTSESARLRTEMRRRMAFVFQKPVVFDMNVYDNIACGLKWRKEKSSEIHKKVDSVLEMVALSSYRHRKARTLSGGEMQRVAIARAVVSEPKLLLLDEPTANLDPASSMKIESLITDIIRSYNTTIVIATHDMPQGQRLADRVSVMKEGEILQSGDWHQVFNFPHNEDVASLVGVENIIEGTIESNQDEIVSIRVGEKEIQAVSDYPVGKEVCACIRPEDVVLAKSQLFTSARNSFPGEIKKIVSFGVLTRVELDCGFPLVALITKKSADEMGLDRGAQIFASFKATGVHVINK